MVLLLYLPTGRSLFRGFLHLLFLPVCDAWAAHLKGYDSLLLMVDNASINSIGSNFLVLRKEGHPRMLAHCLPRTLRLVSVASTNVAPSLQGPGLAKSQNTIIQYT